MFMVVARAETEPNKINYTSIKDSVNNNNNKLVFYGQSTGTVISGRWFTEVWFTLTTTKINSGHFHHTLKHIMPHTLKHVMPHTLKHIMPHTLKHVMPHTLKHIMPHTLKHVMPHTLKHIMPHTLKHIMPHTLKHVMPHTLKHIMPHTLKHVMPHTLKHVMPHTLKHVMPHTLKPGTHKDIYLLLVKLFWKHSSAKKQICFLHLISHHLSVVL